MPVVDDDPQERQLPMFPGQDPRTDLLIRLLTDAVDAVHTLTAINQLLTQKAFGPHARRTAKQDGTIGSLRATSKGAREQKPHRHVPSNPDHRTWRGFVLSMQHLEDEARNVDLKLSKKAVCQLGTDSAKTIVRTMTETYGLRADDWPPSRWDPEKPPAADTTRHIL